MPIVMEATCTTCGRTFLAVSGTLQSGRSYAPAHNYIGSRDATAAFAEVLLQTRAQILTD